MSPKVATRHSRFAPLLLLAVLLASMIALSSQALITYAATPTPTPQVGVVLDKLNPGEAKVGEISATNTEYHYEISGKGSDQVLTGITGDEGFTPALEIHNGPADQKGSTLGVATNDPKTTGSLLLNYTLPKNGKYTLVVKAGPHKGSNVGRFAITFGLVTFKKPVNGTAQGDVLPTNGFPIAGTITFAISRILYKYEGKQGDKLTITQDGFFGLVPALAIRKGDYGDPDVDMITDEAKPDTNSPIALLEYTLPADGPYIIIASHAGFSSGKTAGPFLVSLSVNGASVQDALAPTTHFTQPSSIPDTIDVSGTADQVVGHLHDQKMVPDGGALEGNFYPNLFLRASTPGIKTLPITPGGEVSARNFVANVQVSWTTAGDNSACGISFWSVGTVEFALAILGNNGTVELFQRSANEFPIQYVDRSTFYTPGQPTTITLIVIGDNVSFYINGNLKTTAQGKSKYGAINAALVNATGNTKLTTCNYPSGWIWRF